MISTLSAERFDLLKCNGRILGADFMEGANIAGNASAVMPL